VTFKVLQTQGNRIEEVEEVEHADWIEETLVINKHQPEWANSDFVHNTQVPVSKETVVRSCRNSCIFMCLQIENIAIYFKKAQVSWISSTTQGIFQMEAENNVGGGQAILRLLLNSTWFNHAADSSTVMFKMFKCGVQIQKAEEW
jgi:hypothetical protein